MGRKNGRLLGVAGLGILACALSACAVGASGATLGSQTSPAATAPAAATHSSPVKPTASPVVSTTPSTSSITYPTNPSAYNRVISDSGAWDVPACAQMPIWDVYHILGLAPSAPVSVVPQLVGANSACEFRSTSSKSMVEFGAELWQGTPSTDVLTGVTGPTVVEGHVGGSTIYGRNGGNFQSVQLANGRTFYAGLVMKVTASGTTFMPVASQLTTGMEDAYSHSSTS